MKFEEREKITNSFKEWKTVAYLLLCLFEVCGYMVYIYFFNLQMVSSGDFKP